MSERRKGRIKTQGCCALQVRRPNTCDRRAKCRTYQPFERKRLKFDKKLLTKQQACDIISKHYGGIAQLARAIGSYPIGRGFKSNSRYGPLVKRLRHRPFTAVTWVRFPYGSPKKETGFSLSLFFVVRESKN